MGCFMRRHIAGASYLFVADIAVRALNFVAMAWIARTLAPELYGTIIIGASVLDYALLLSDWGLKTLGTRETARMHGERRYRPSRIVATRIVLGGAVFIVANLLITVLPLAPMQSVFVRIYLLGLLPYILHLDWYHQGNADYLIITVARTLGSICLLVGAITLVHSPSDASVVPWLYVSSITATTIAMIVAVRSPRQLTPHRDDFAGVGDVLKVSSALGVAALCGQTFMILPPIISGQISGPASAGILHAALRIVVMVLIVDRVFGALFLPALSRAWSQDQKRGSRRLDSAFRIVVALGVGASAMCMVFAHEIIRVVYAHQYVDAGRVLVYLSPFVAATLVNTFLAYGLIAMGEERQYLRAGLRSAALFIVMLVAGTYYFGLVGTASAMVLGEVAMCLLLYSAFRRHARLHVFRPIIVSLGSGMAVVAAAGVIGYVSLWQAPLYVAAFAVCVFLLRGVESSDFRTVPS